MNDIKYDNLYKKDSRYYDLDQRPALMADIPFYLEHAVRNRGELLEIGCGSGRVTIPLARAGHKVLGLEYSQSMLDVLRGKLTKLPIETAAKIRLIQQDMCCLDLPQTFPLIIITGRSFQMLADEKKEITALKRIHRHLEDGGTFIFTTGNPKTYLDLDWSDKSEQFEWQNIDPQTGNMVRSYHIREHLDREKQILYPLIVFRIIKKDGSEEKIQHPLAWKYFTIEQLTRMVESNGFEIVETRGEFNGSKPIGQGIEFIFVCRKKE